MKLRNALVLVGLPLGLAALGLAIPDAIAQTVTNLYSFRLFTDGSNPYAGLTQGRDGNFYGTTFTAAEPSNQGTVFRISPTGSFTNLYFFSGSDGCSPFAALVQGSDGNFYGTTYGGGASTNCSGFSGGIRTVGCGTVFRISPSGTLTTLYSFTGSSDGANPYAGLVQGSDGNFYGTTPSGGTNGAGNIFRISASGAFTNLYSFTGGSDGANPLGRLMQAGDGNFYGTTSGGGTNGYGTVFQMTPSGTLMSLHSFIGSDGMEPISWLVEGNDGNLYGTTVGGPYNFALGTVFRISPSGSFTNLHSFTGGGDGYALWAGLVQGSDGNCYGSTYSGFGVESGYGTLFRISPTGSVSNLYSFGGGFDGWNPMGGLVQGIDGSFYGTTIVGGHYQQGTVFKLSVPLNPPANQISEIQFFNVLDTTIVAVPIPSVAGETYQLQYSDSMSPTNWLNTGGTITSIGGPLVLTDIAEALPPQRFYRAVITP